MSRGSDSVVLGNNFDDGQDRIGHALLSGRPTGTPRFVTVLPDLLTQLRANERHQNQCVVARQFGPHSLKVLAPVSTPARVDERHPDMRRSLSNSAQHSSVLPLLPLVATNEQDVKLRRNLGNSLRDLSCIANGLLLKRLNPPKFLIVVLGRESVVMDPVEQASGIVDISFSRQLVNQGSKLLKRILVFAFQLLTLGESDFRFSARPAGLIVSLVRQQFQESIQADPLHGESLQAVEHIRGLFAIAHLQASGKAGAQIPCRSLAIPMLVGTLAQGIGNFTTPFNRLFAFCESVQRSVSMFFEENTRESLQVGSGA